jgi:TonB-linked SusC/RagA family outer membrane protein
MTKIVYFLLLTVIFFPLLSFAQENSVKITGKVIDEKTQEPVIGASISLAGSKKTGTASDVDGNFSLVVKSLPATIFIDYLGYKKQEIDIYESSELIIIQLREDKNVLNEVVVVGYGTQKRKELTGAIATVAKSYLEYNTAPSVDALLSGAVAGVNITHISGQPGAGSEIRIRGGNSVYASNEPLYVIDGFIYFSEKGLTEAGVSGIGSSLNPLSSLNPADIESIEILKDVSAKAIYGSRGANGVILVTTKKGTRGKNTVQYQYTFGVDKSAKKLDLLNADQWLKINRDIFHNSTHGDPQWITFNNAQIAANNGKNTDTDWQNAVLQTGLTQTHDLSISGGDDNTRYSISGNYTKQEGIILNSGFERLDGHINLDRKLSANLTVGVNANIDRSTQDALTTLVPNDYAGSSNPFKSGITNSLVYALFMPPVVPIYVDNEYNHYNPFEITELNYYGTAANPVTDLKESIGQTITTSLLGNFYAKYDIPYIKGLTAKFSAGTNVNYITQNFFAPPYTVLGLNKDIVGRASVGNRRTDVSQTEYLLTYTKQIAPAHYIDLLGGYTAQITKTNIIIAKADHIENFKNLGFGHELPLYSTAKQGNLHSILGRINYTLLERYNLTATYRADKSSRFSVGNEWGFFPSVGLSWNISDEAFFKKSKNGVSDLKYRLTYGKTGNTEIGFDEFAVILDAARYGGEPAAVLGNPGNENLMWEITTEYNTGVDAGLFNNRLSLAADLYFKETSRLLSKRPVFGSDKEQTTNIGGVSNKGFELSLNAKLIERRSLNLSFAANFARNINTITALAANNYTIGDNQEQILRVGESVGSFYGFIYDGVIQENEDISKLPAKSGQTLQAGDVKLRDTNGPNGLPDGMITKGIPGEDDRTIIGSIQPDFTYGFSTTLTYGKWDFFASLQGSKGNEVYNKLRRHLSENNKTYNLSSELLNAWTTENPSAEVPRLDAVIDDKSLYSRYVEDGSFLKLRNITLGYTLPVKIDKLPVKFRFFVSGKNLATITRYKGYDPEVAGGIDTGAYPASRTLLFGFGATF